MARITRPIRQLIKADRERNHVFLRFEPRRNVNVEYCVRLNVQVRGKQVARLYEIVECDTDNAVRFDRLDGDFFGVL